MPIQFSEQDTKLSLAYAVNATQETFTRNQTDGFMKDAAKVVARIPTNAVLGVLATVETVVKAALTVLSTILYPITDGPLNYLKASTALAGRATVEAFKGIAGFSTTQPVVVEEAPAPVVVEEAPVVETPVAPQGANKVKIAVFVLGAIVLGVTAYYFRANIANDFSGPQIVDNRRPVAPGLLFPPTYKTCAPDKAMDDFLKYITAVHGKLRR